MLKQVFKLSSKHLRVAFCKNDCLDFSKYNKSSVKIMIIRINIPSSHCLESEYYGNNKCKDIGFRADKK